MSMQRIIKILTDGGIELSEARVEAELLLEHFCGYDAKKQIMGVELPEEDWAFVSEKARERVETRRPIQHIIGLADFMGEKFIVNEHTLIPRDETELLVREAVRIIKENDLNQAIEIGAGSGCVACMVAKLAEIPVIGLDISNEALHIALDNATKHNLFNRAIFRKSDVYSNVREREKFDIIISNPPYIPISQKGSLQKEVEFDPEIALFAPDEDGVEFYKRIIEGAHRLFVERGFVVLELGINQAPLVERIFIENGFEDIKISKDLAGIDRVISARLEV